MQTSASACKPSHHSFLSFPSNYYNVFFSLFFCKFHPSLCRLNSHCNATNQWLITVKCLSPSSFNSNRANYSGKKLMSLSQWCQTTSTCTHKKKKNPRNFFWWRSGRLLHTVVWCSAPGGGTCIATATPAWARRAPRCLLHVQIIAFRKQKKNITE